MNKMYYPSTQEDKHQISGIMSLIHVKFHFNYELKN